jgi:hypothetical protein
VVKVAKAVLCQVGIWLAGIRGEGKEEDETYSYGCLARLMDSRWLGRTEPSEQYSRDFICLSVGAWFAMRRTGTGCGICLEMAWHRKALG